MRVPISYLSRLGTTFIFWHAEEEQPGVIKRSFQMLKIGFWILINLKEITVVGVA